MTAPAVTVDGFGELRLVPLRGLSDNVGCVVKTGGVVYKVLPLGAGDGWLLKLRDDTASGWVYVGPACGEVCERGALVDVVGEVVSFRYERVLFARRVYDDGDRVAPDALEPLLVQLGMPPFTPKEDLEARVAALLADGMSANAIAKKVGGSRPAVLAEVRRQKAVAQLELGGEGDG